MVDLGSKIIFCAIACHHCLAILMLQGNNKKNLGKHWGRKEEDLKGKKKEISTLHPNTITLCYILYCRDLFFAELNASPILDSFYLLFRNFSVKNGILLPKLFWPTVRKNCSNDREQFLKFEAEGREFAKFLRSIEQFLVTECFFNLFLEVSQI